MIRRHRVDLAVLGIVLVAVNLRVAITSVGPVLDEIRSGLGLSGVEAALLTTTPVVCFSLVGSFAPALARRIGIEATLTAAVAGIAAGLLLRASAGEGALFGGTVLAGGSIALANVLLPALVKRDYAHRVGMTTGLYTTAMGIASAVAAGTTVPIAAALGHGWRGGLGVWALLAVVALVALLPRLRSHTVPPRTPPQDPRPLLRDRRAWQVTLFTGLQSLGYYATVSWLPTIYQDHGSSATHAGLLLSIASIVGTPFGLVVPALAARRRDQRAWTAALTVLMTIGFLGILAAPTAAPYLWVVLLGIGLGASFPLALTLVVLRSRTTLETARLSALAQTVGYLIAALGPLVVGALHDVTGSWTPALAFLAALTVPQLLAGLGAGRPGHILAQAAGTARAVSAAREDP